LKVVHFDDVRVKGFEEKNGRLDLFQAVSRLSDHFGIVDENLHEAERYRFEYHCRPQSYFKLE
jgi:hypothetical protein